MTSLIPAELTEEEANAQLERIARIQHLQAQNQPTTLSPVFGKSLTQKNGQELPGTFDDDSGDIWEEDFEIRRATLPRRLFTSDLVTRMEEETSFRDRWIESQATQQGYNRLCLGNDCTGYIHEWYGPLDLSKPGVGFKKKACPTCPRGFRWGEEEETRAENEKVREYRMSMIAGSGLPVEGPFKNKTLATFAATKNGKAKWYEDFMKWFDEVWIKGECEEGKTGAVLLGGYGVGKTGLAVGLGVELINRLEVRVLYMNVADFAEQIGRAWAAKDGSDFALLDRMKTRQLLILNDLGAGHGRATDWDDKSPMQYLFNVLETRYNKGLPVVITSNCESPDGLKAIIGQRNFNRVFDSCKLFVCAGQNLRKGVM